MENLTSSIIIAAAVSIVGWTGRQMATRLLASLTRLTDAVTELRLDVKGLSVTVDGIIKRVEKVEANQTNNNSNGSYGSYPNRPSKK